MFKTFARTIVYNSVSKQSFQTLTKQRVREQSQTPGFWKPKKTKHPKMLRSWEFTDEARDCQRQQALKSGIPLQQYRLVSYNILAQDLLVEHFYLYHGIDMQHLRWDHRLSCLKNELTYLDPDILCIQEMQFSHIKEFVARLSEKRKLEYIFKKKTGHRSDGCAIIYDKDKFKLIAQQDIEFYKPSCNRLNRENVALLARFQLCHEPDKQIVIGTTHLLFNPRRHDVRVAQVDMLLENLTNFARKCSQSTNPYFPVILTGDMNSQPNSPPFTRLTSPFEIITIEGEVDSNMTNDIIIIDDDDDDDDSNVPKGGVSEDVHQVNNEKSARFQLSAVDFGRSCASTYHDRWITVDYVLRSIRDVKDANKEISDVKVLSIYKLPTVKNCLRIGKIPNQYLGSDHYVQAIEFIVV